MKLSIKGIFALFAGKKKEPENPVQGLRDYLLADCKDDKQREALAKHLRVQDLSKK